MKTKLILIGKILGVLVILCLLGVFAFYLYLCRTIDVPTSNQGTATSGSYLIVDTAQNTYWDSKGLQISKPLQGENYYGQDAQYEGNMPSYKDNGDGTTSDNVTGLMWTQSLDINNDGTIDSNDKMTLEEAISSVADLNIGGYSDWRMPTIKELYSLINFNGVDPKLYETENLKPFIDENYFEFGYGDLSTGERTIDAQVATQTIYVEKTFIGFQTMFGVNFADGRIKGYPTTVSMNGVSASKFYVLYVRGNNAYGVNSYVDNGDETISDNATSLMWSKSDSTTGMNWEQALTWVNEKNAENYLGYDDWRLPNIKELQSIVDYTRSPSTTSSPALDSIFDATKITNENEKDDYGYYWSSTTHISQAEPSGAQAAYICFGRGMGNMFSLWMDVHGSGSQRSEFKEGDPTDYPSGYGPQGDAIRIFNYVRLVRDND